MTHPTTRVSETFLVFNLKLLVPGQQGSQAGGSEKSRKSLSLRGICR